MIIVCKMYEDVRFTEISDSKMSIVGRGAEKDGEKLAVAVGERTGVPCSSWKRRLSAMDS